MNIRRIGIIGSGKFGRLLVEILPLIFPGATVGIFSRHKKGTASWMDIVSSDLIIPAVPTNAFESVIKQLAPEIADTIVMDVCSVKEYPVKIMQQFLPSSVSQVATHPLFGPGTWEYVGKQLRGLKMVMTAIHIDRLRYEKLKSSFTRTGINIIEMGPQEHDRHAASFHFTAQYVAQLLKNSGLQRSPIETQSAESLFDFLAMVQSDSPELLQDMMRYNRFCKVQLVKLEHAQREMTRSLLFK